jgi:hypothetical protein
MCVTLCFWMSLNISSGRVVGERTTLPPWKKYPWMPGHASGRLCAIGSASSRTESPVTPQTGAAVFELYA